MKFKLNYAHLDESQIVEMQFEYWIEVLQFIRKEGKKDKSSRVYLYNYGQHRQPECDNTQFQPIIVTANFWHIERLFEWENKIFREHHVHEYISFADAFEIATMMMEPHPLCYPPQ